MLETQFREELITQLSLIHSAIGDIAPSVHKLTEAVQELSKTIACTEDGLPSIRAAINNVSNSVLDA